MHARGLNHAAHGCSVPAMTDQPRAPAGPPPTGLGPTPAAVPTEGAAAGLQGALAQARVIAHMVQTQLGGLIERTYRDAQAQAAGGRTIEALAGFAETLELHRLN